LIALFFVPIKKEFTYTPLCFLDKKSAAIQKGYPLLSGLKKLVKALPQMTYLKKITPAE
jgi:hypothetical protein